MSYSFKNTPAKPSFGSNKESMEAGDYILNKKKKIINCNSSKPNCNNNNNLNNFNNYNLNINLATKLDLTNISIIEDASGNICPTTIIYSEIPNFYNRYIIDPKGELFVNTECGVNNFLSYLVLNTDVKNKN